MQKKPKSINALMAYMRDEKGLNAYVFAGLL